MTPVTALAAALVLVVLAYLPRDAGPSDDAGGSSGPGGVGGHGGGGPLSRGGQAWRPSRWLMRRRACGEDTDLGLVLTEVAGRLRAGAEPIAAWSAALERAGLKEAGLGDAGTTSGRLTGRDVASAAELLEGLLERAPRARHAAELRAAMVACRLTEDLGAPMADVLDRCATGLSEAAQARDARHIALAGPRATARLLAWLPLVGLALAAVMGASPLAVLTDGGWGSAAGVVGVALMVAARRWTAGLVRQAEQVGMRSRRRDATVRGRAAVRDLAAERDRGARRR